MGNSISNGGQDGGLKVPSDKLVDFVRRFRARFETLHPVRFERFNLKDHMGETAHITRKGKSYLLVRVNKSLSLDAQLLVLIHELAHCLQWRTDAQEVSRDCEHDPEWGLAIARIWTSMMDNT